MENISIKLKLKGQSNIFKIFNIFVVNLNYLRRLHYNSNEKICDKWSFNILNIIKHNINVHFTSFLVKKCLEFLCQIKYNTICKKNKLISYYKMYIF